MQLVVDSLMHVALMGKLLYVHFHSFFVLIQQTIKFPMDLWTLALYF